MKLIGTVNFGLRLSLFLLILGFSGILHAQNLSLPLANQAYIIVDRLQLQSDFDPGFHSAIKPYLRADVVEFGLKAIQSDLTAGQKRDIQYLFDDNNEFVLGMDSSESVVKKYVDSSRTFFIEEVKAGTADPVYTFSKRPILRHFYRTPANFFEVDTRNFYLRVNPLLDLTLGRELKEESAIFHNRRGLELRGGIGHKVYFSTRIIENQALFANYFNTYVDTFNAVPSAGLYKNFRSSLFDLENARDYVQADGYVGFDLIPNIGMQLGHGRNFLGDGMRSLLLSDFSPEYFYLKFNTRVWKFHYQNIFAELAAESVRDSPSSTIVEKKYLAAHYLSFKPRENLAFGVYEAVIFNREAGFELQYLNPIIFYRTLELNLGSPDNALLGFTARWDILKRVSVYGQFVLDDIKVREVLDGRLGWWGNKVGGQLGLKYFDAFGIDHLDLMLETNHVRPFTYSHRDSSSNYTHFNQALAHPLGANFKEWIVHLRYWPTPRLQADIRTFLVKTGDDSEGTNFGTNIVRPNTTRGGNYGHETAQGSPVDITILSLELGYQLRHNLWIDVQYFYRNRESAIAGNSLKTSWIRAGLRLNLASQNFYF